jgi:Skp family chaperone for outer membrane proteins
MAKIVEVDEAEWNRMQALQQVAVKIAGNPGARKIFEQAHKMVDPNASTPMTDQERAHNEPLNALKTEFQTKLDALQKERDDEKRDTTLRQLADKQERDFARLKSEHRYTDEGVAAVRKLMETKGLLDVDDAVAVFERANPPQMPATPSGGHGSSWGFVEQQDQSDEMIKQLIATKGENDYLADRMAQQALQDFRAGKR